MVLKCHSSCPAVPVVASGGGRSAGLQLDLVEVVEVAIRVGQRMVINENQEERELVEENENVVVDGCQDPWGEDHKNDQDGNEGSLSD